MSEYATLDPLKTRIATHREHSERTDDVQQAVLDALRLNDDESLLDVGAGTGEFLFHLRERGHTGRLVGVDSSPAAVHAIGAYAGVEAYLADAQSLAFGDETFECAAARHMLYHVPDVDQALSELARVVRRGSGLRARRDARRSSDSR